MSYLPLFCYTFFRIPKDVVDLDYMEILSFCAFDVQKAHEMAKQYGVIPFSETIRDSQETETERMSEDGNTQ